MSHAADSAGGQRRRRAVAGNAAGGFHARPSKHGHVGVRLQSASRGARHGTYLEAAESDRFVAAANRRDRSIEQHRGFVRPVERYRPMANCARRGRGRKAQACAADLDTRPAHMRDRAVGREDDVSAAHRRDRAAIRLRLFDRSSANGAISRALPRSKSIRRNPKRCRLRRPPPRRTAANGPAHWRPACRPREW